MAGRHARPADERQRRRIGGRRVRPLALLGWVFVVLVGLALWPQRFGGATTLVVVHGRSMEPTYHGGDLLVVRSADVEVGDIAVYRMPSGIGAGQNVVHRVVGKDPDGTLTFQGDAKELPDDARARREDVVGRPVVNLGPLPLRFLSVVPLLAAVVAALAVGWWIWPAPLPRRADDRAG